MDQSRDILELSQTFKIDLDHVPYIGKSCEKKKVARRRWAILAKALKVHYYSVVFKPYCHLDHECITLFLTCSLE